MDGTAALGTIRAFSAFLGIRRGNLDMTRGGDEIAASLHAANSFTADAKSIGEEVDVL